MTTYAVYKTVKARAEQMHNDAAKRLQEVSGTEKGPMGMVPDHIKSTQDWQIAYKTERAMFAGLRAINGHGAKHFKKEMAEDRKARRGY